MGTVTGLAGGEKLVAIDVRPATGQLYGLGDKSGVYQLDQRSAGATMKSTLKTADGAALSLQGARFGIDFNPTVDRLRVISDAGQNLRINADTGATTVDQVIAYGSGDRSSGRPKAVAAAYTNNDNDSYVTPALIPFNRPAATGTKLYTIDSARDSLAVQDPPNDGTLKTVGRLRQRTTSAVGFDVYSFPNSEGDTASNTGFASLSRGGSARLYKVNLATGRAKRVKGARSAFSAVQDIAIVP